MSRHVARKPRIFTIGHSDMTLDQLFLALESSSIRLVIDVRSNPASSRFPHFERNALATALEKRGLVYRWFRGLGGKRKNVPEAADHTALKEDWERNYAAAMNDEEFSARVQELFGLAASTVAVILCAERDYRKCHRRLLSDKLTIEGAEMVHIVDNQEVVVHDVHPDLLVENKQLFYKKKQLELID